MEKKIIRNCYKNRTGYCKNGFQKYTTAEASGRLIGNKIAEKVVKLAENSRNVEEINISPEKK